MLGQRTLVAGPMAPCPIHTARRPRTAYPLLCAPVRHPVPAEPEEIELEDNYEDDEEDDPDIVTVDVGDVPTPSLWISKTEKRPSLPKVKTKSTTVRVFTALQTRKYETKMYQRATYKPQTSTTVKESIIQKLDRELEQKTRNKVNFNMNYKEAQNSYENSQFDNVVRNDWRARKKPNFGQWRQNQENAENMEEVIPLTTPRPETTETVEQTLVEVYRPTLREDVPRTLLEVYRPTLREDRDNIEHEESNFRPRWRQTRLRPQRPGANALLTYSSTGKPPKKEYIVS
ncbi:hypothetical protein HF086_017210 [Spodoptera exigua]|uniref:Uncharacterized protein n=1 Tax=Spodoptera exigua TaxID=7107 RepID=A0A922ME58_SPOEX|nr:hypothetical protein HF086_017210 [Spodoptera exigua]